MLFFIDCFQGRVIIQEKSFPDRRKSIKPCDSLGGIAGGLVPVSDWVLTIFKGQKFIKEGILFKFAIPSKLFQEDIEAAMKVKYLGFTSLHLVEHLKNWLFFQGVVV